MLPSVSDEWLKLQNVSIDNYQRLNIILKEKSFLFSQEVYSWSMIKDSIADALHRLDLVTPSVLLCFVDNKICKNDVLSEDNKHIIQSLEVYGRQILSMVFTFCVQENVSTASCLLKNILNNKKITNVGMLRCSIFGLKYFYMYVPFSVEEEDVSCIYYCWLKWLLVAHDSWMLGMYLYLVSSSLILVSENENKIEKIMKSRYERMKVRLELSRKLFFFLPNTYFQECEGVLGNLYECFQSSLSPVPVTSNALQNEAAPVTAAVNSYAIFKQSSWDGWLGTKYLQVSSWQWRMNHRDLVVASDVYQVESLLCEVMQKQTLIQIDPTEVLKQMAMIRNPVLQKQVCQLLLAWRAQAVGYWVREHMEKDSFVLTLGDVILENTQWLNVLMKHSDDLSQLMSEWCVLQEHAGDIFAFQWQLCSRVAVMEEINGNPSDWRVVLVKHGWLHSSLIECDNQSVEGACYEV